MVRASVFFENRIHLRSVELFEDFISQAQQLIDRFNQIIIRPEKLKASRGVVPFSYDSTDAKKTFSYVALLHLIVFLLLYSLSEFHQKKTPEITIELGDAPKASNGVSSSAAEQANPNPIKNAPKVAPSEPVDPDVIKAGEIKRLDRKKELELEREKRKEMERDRQRQKNRDREIELERVKELEQDRKRARELELEKKKEQERERQRARELEQEKKKEEAKLKEQERQQKLRAREQEKEEEKQRQKEQLKEKLKEKVPEPKKLDKDGTLPPPPAKPVASPTPAPTPTPSAPASPPPSPSSPPASSGASASQSAAGGASSMSGVNNSISASISSAPASAPTLDAEPKPLSQNNPKPAYPLLAFKMKIQGKVILIVDVSESGSVNKVSVAESSGNESLDRSALDAVKNWKFTPARRNGVIVGQVVKVPITFSLKNR